MKSIDWYWDTAQHMWRTYFAIDRTHPDTLTESARYIYATCKQILESDFSERDVTILKAARARGRHGGRPTVGTERDKKQALAMYHANVMSCREIAERFNVSLSTLNRWIRAEKG